MVNMVNATFPELFTSPVFFFGMQMWHLPSLPYNYSSVLHICNIFARSTFVQKLLFRPVPVTIINLSA